MAPYAALVSGTGWHVQDLLRAAGRLGLDLRPLPFATLSATIGGEVRAGGLDLRTTGGVLLRMMPPGSLEQVVFRMDALRAVVASGVPVLNPPEAFETAVDKYLSLERIGAAGLPVPETWCGQSAREALGAFERLGGDVVVKPLFGAEGRGLVRVSDRELARRAFGTLERLGAVLYVQRFVPNSGSDLRAFVLDGRVVAAMRRWAAPGDWRANVAVGGRPEPYALDAHCERLATEAARAVGARMAGVDLLPSDSGEVLVLEVNAVPGWRALSRTTGADVAAMVLESLR